MSIKFNSTGEPDTYRAEVLFPNKKGVQILKRTTLGESDVFEVMKYKPTTLIPDDLDCSNESEVTFSSEADVSAYLDKIRILSPD